MSWLSTEILFALAARLIDDAAVFGDIRSH
jgi:hypothetical protein